MRVEVIQQVMLCVTGGVADAAAQFVWHGCDTIVIAVP